MTPPSGVFVLVLAGERAVGCGGFKRLDGETCEIKRMYLRPEGRGRGLGRQMLEALLDAARQGGYREARLDTDGLMPAAVQLYITAGFEPCTPHTVPWKTWNALKSPVGEGPPIGSRVACCCCDQSPISELNATASSG